MVRSPAKCASPYGCQRPRGQRSQDCISNPSPLSLHSSFGFLSFHLYFCFTYNKKHIIKTQANDCWFYLPRWMKTYVSGRKKERKEKEKTSKAKNYSQVFLLHVREVGSQSQAAKGPDCHSERTRFLVIVATCLHK